jgi:Zn-dependent protease
MILTLREIIDILFMTAIIGFIFKDVFIKPKLETYDPLTNYKKRFNFKDLGYVALMVAPAIILHEFGHKFVAMAFGMQAVFHAAYLWLFVGLMLKLLNFGFIFFVPAYVAWGCSAASCTISPAAPALIAVAGPLVNAALYAACWGLIRYKKTKRSWMPFIFATKRITGFLFILNMLPIPGFDGYHFYSAMGGIIFG